MKTILISAAAAFLAVATAHAQTTTKTTTTTENPDGSTTTREQITTSTGTLGEYVPGSTFVVREEAGPVSYAYGPLVVYATRSGTVLTPEQIHARIRVGLPVHVEFRNEGKRRIIQRVLIDD